MNHRLLLIVAAVAAVCAALGLLAVDYALAHWIHESGLENLALFPTGLAALDWVFGIPLWFWLAATVAIGLGIVGLIAGTRVPRRVAVALLVAGLVQLATLHTMIQMKGWFGRLRPHQVFESGDWNMIWHAGGGSFPSGHSAFYFGLLLPVAAFATRTWQRTVLIAIALFVVLARIDMSMHFLSDVSVSALIAALYSLLAALIVRASGVLWHHGLDRHRV